MLCSQPRKWPSSTSGGDPDTDKDRWAAFIDPVVEVLDIEAVLDEHLNSGVQIVRVEK